MWNGSLVLGWIIGLLFRGKLQDYFWLEPSRFFFQYDSSLNEKRGFQEKKTFSNSVYFG